MLTERLHRLIVEKEPAMDVRKRLQDGVVSVGWQPLARVQVTSQTEHRVEWNAECLARTSLSREAMGQALAAAFVDAADSVTWG